MKLLVVFLFFSSAFLTITCDLVFPMKFEDLDKSCRDQLKSSSGTLQLEKDCTSTTNNEIVGYIRSIGAVVCCVPMKILAPNEIKIVRNTKRSGERARKYCEAHGSGVQSLLDFHIIGGERSDVGEFPHMVSIGFPNLDNAIEFKCGGALISEKFIVTAAHCSSVNGRSPSVVRLGRTSLDLFDASDTGIAIDTKIKAITNAPGYVTSQKYKDIALMELEDPMVFTTSVQPICLETDDSQSDVARNFTIIGFGVSNDTTKVKSDWLLKAEITEVPFNECRSKYEPANLRGFKENVAVSQVCARDFTEKSADSCQGDSGSPLQITVDYKYHLYGLTSFGLGCGSNFPAVYTRISSYIDWIEGIVWPEN